MNYEDALKYLQELNEQTFAGYHDWRLPTIPELLSLLEPTRQQESLGFYIDPIFPLPPSGHYGCWSADRRPSKSDIAWSVSFVHARVPGFPLPLNFVRAVRSAETPLTAMELNNELSNATRYGDVEKVKALIAAGADVNSRTFNDHTPLTMAAYYGYTEIMKMLIAAGADVNAVHCTDETVLSDALISGQPRAEVIRLLLDAGVKLDRTALVTVVQNLSKRETVSERNERLKIMSMLIEAGADVNAEEQTLGLTPFVYAACIGGERQFMELLLRSGAEINATVGMAGITALGCAVDMKQIETVKFLIKAGVDPEKADKSGKTPLMKAQSKHSEKIIKLLKDAGATR